MDLVEVMLRLGSKSTYDPNLLSKSTVASSNSHLRTLKKNNIAINEQLTRDTSKMLDRLTNRNGDLLDDQYKRQIGMTIKRLFPNKDIDLSKYEKNRSKSRKSTTRLSSEHYVSSLKQIIDRVAYIIQDVYITKRVEDLGLYDTCIAILLTISTSLRINELLQLRITHIAQILDKQPINIGSKGRKDIRIIAPTNMLKGVFEAINAQRTKVYENISVKKLDYATQYQLDRYKNGFLLINSIDYMRKKLKELAASLTIKTQPLGFNSFRKYITSILVEGGAHLVAQSMNNHSSLNTTLNHYNVVAPQTVQNTFDALFNNTKQKESNSVEKIKADVQRQVLSEQVQRPLSLNAIKNNQKERSTISHVNELPATSSSGAVTNNAIYRRPKPNFASVFMTPDNTKQDFIDDDDDDDDL